MVENERNEAEDKNNKEAVRQWARAQIEAYKKNYPGYEKYAEVLGNVLKQVAKKYAPQAIVQARPKAIGSFAEKIFRKRDKCDDPVNQFTDLCGGRIIVQTEKEVKNISLFIEDYFDIDWENTIDVKQRLKPTEFGYRSIHYIVRFKKDGVKRWINEISVEVPELLYSMSNPRAEIQVRTILEHAWADMAHDLAYKSSFKLPERLEREFATLAATLEDADKDFSRLEDEFGSYAATYGEYMKPEEIQEEIAIQEIVLENDPENVKVAATIGKLALIIEDFDKAIEILSPFAAKSNPYPPILRDLGVAICKKCKGGKRSRKYRQGQRYLERAVELDNKDVDAICSLAGTYKGLDEEKSRQLYRQAFSIDPSNPYPLTNFLSYEVQLGKDIDFIYLIRPTLEAAINRCRRQIEVGVNMPWACFDIGKFYLLLGEPYESLEMYARAVEKSNASWMIETSLNSLNILEVVKDKLEGFEWVRRFLLIALAAKFPEENPAAVKEVKALVSKGCKKLSAPVVIVVGGCDPKQKNQLRAYRQFLLQGFKDFQGTIISGGTEQGISGFVGELGEKYASRICTIGYLPRFIQADDATVDRRYSQLRYTDGSGFSPLEPLQNWIDIVASGVNPSEVKVLAISGGKITRVELALALTLGASVGIVEESGREAGKILIDEDWANSENLKRLAAEAAALKTFLKWGKLTEPNHNQRKIRSSSKG